VSRHGHHGKQDDQPSDQDGDKSSTPRDEYEGRARFEGGLQSRMLRFVLPHRKLLGLALLLFPLVAAAQLAQPYVIKLAIDGPIQGGLPDQVGLYAAVFLGLILSQAILQFLQTLTMQLAGQRVMRDVRTQLFDRVLRLAPSYFDRTPQGKVLTRLTGDVEALNEFLSTGLVSVIADTVLLVGIVVIMLMLDARLAAVSFAFVLPVVFGMAQLRGRLREVFRAVRNRSTALNIYLQESLVGMLIVQAFRREELNRAQYEERNRGWYDKSMHSLTLASVISASVQLAETLTLALLFWVALGHVLGVDASLGLVVAFVSYIERFYSPIDNLSGRFTVLQTALASSEKVFSLLDEDDELPRPADPAPIAPLAEGLQLDHVSFHYATSEPVLHEVTIDVPRGHTVALVGATGAGKSTIVKLLGRFYDPQGGAVRWDGRDVREFDLQALRQRVAYVPQETFLFSATLGENIALDPDRITSDAVTAAAAAVTADRVAQDLPRGYDQVLGERGHDLSAGERQLVSFARALAADPDVLILDEATANVDGETEERIQRALDRLLEGRTAVVIAHRLSTVKKANKIVVLHKGRVREEGTHDELLERKGLYWKLYRLQSEEAA
jgi:ATP-binding cassette, subfamily B, multidrug efflux pump